MLHLIPHPKQIELHGESMIFPPVIDCAPCAECFSFYRDSFRKIIGLELCQGNGGIVCKKDSDLAGEAYKIDCRTSVILSAGAAEGFCRAFATLLQLVRKEKDRLTLPRISVYDYPDAPHRALMVDVARQWHPFEYLKRYVDLCAFYKISRLQLHFTDDQSFTLPMKAYPALSTEGRTYTREEIAGLVRYAAHRSVLLIPEVDMPGHCAQFCLKYPEIFGQNGVLPACERVFDALKTILTEVAELFPSAPYLHIGGDEAAIANWEKCPDTQEYMRVHGISDVHEMYAEYIRIMTDFVLASGKTPIVWEGFPKEYNEKISKKTVVCAWESYYQPAYDLAPAGFPLINASWKPLYIVTPGKYWSAEEILSWNIRTWRHWWEKSAAYPDGFSLADTPCNILGGQLCAWGDFLKDLSGHDIDAGLEQEFSLIAERLPALSEKTWNDAPASFEHYRQAYLSTEEKARRLCGNM